MLSPAQPSPQLKHKLIEQDLRALTGSLPVGARLPAERELAQSYGCNFLTVRRALKQLVADGSIVRQSGRGTFVAEKAKIHLCRCAFCGHLL